MKLNMRHYFFSLYPCDNPNEELYINDSFTRKVIINNLDDTYRIISYSKEKPIVKNVEDLKYFIEKYLKERKQSENIKNRL